MSTNTLYNTSPLPPLPPPPLTTTTAAAAAAAVAAATSPSGTISENLNNVGLGYSIAIAFGFLVLLSTVLLSFYIFCRSAAARRHLPPNNPSSSSNDNAVYLPRVIFVGEDDDEEANGNANSNQNVAVGLEQAVINSYPKFIYSKNLGNTNNNHNNGGGGNDTMCAICLCDYRDAEMLRMLPDCKHYFHVMCVDTWLKLSASCPVCRNSPLPTPLSTPLSEVVPLSQYSDGRRRV